MSTHWAASKEELRREKFWNTAPTDHRREARKHGGAHFDRVLHTTLMPDSPMPVGPHAEKTMRQTPPDYLAWVNSQRWAASWTPWGPVADYLTRFPIEHAEAHVWPQHIAFVTQLQACAPTQDWPGHEHALLTCHPDRWLHEDKFHTFAQGALNLRPKWYDRDRQAYRLTAQRRQKAIDCGAFALPASPASVRAEFVRIREDGQITCTKHCYVSENEAQQAIDHCMKRPRNRPKQLRSYECPRCGFWHLTSKPE
jgi:hypothetical protein